MINFFKTLADLVFPPRCGGCGELLQPALHGEQCVMCKSCDEEWEREMRAECPDCFAVYTQCRCMPRSLERAGCVELVKLAPYTNDARARLVRHIVLALKKATPRHTLDFLAKELESGILAALERAGCAATDAILVHIPRDRKHRRRDGADQSEALASAIGRRMGITHAALLYRKGHTKAQKELNAKERAANLTNAFGVREVPRGKCVILVDDVVTTGATMSVGAAMLRAAGAGEVIAVAIAQTEKKQKR